MSLDLLRYWVCPKCHGTGNQIIGGKLHDCYACDSTGNAFVDGEAVRHKREVGRLLQEELEGKLGKGRAP